MKTSRLRKLYDKARTDGRESFRVPEGELLVTYCKYLLEYLDSHGVKEFEFTRQGSREPRASSRGDDADV